MMLGRAFRWIAAAVMVAPVGLLSGCGDKAEKIAEAAAPVIKPVSVTLAEIERRPVERTVDVVGTLKGWEEVTLGSKRPGRVLKVLKDIGDTVKPGETLVELETTDAKLAVMQAESRLLAELALLGITRKQAEEYVAKFGITERLISGDEVQQIIAKTPAVVQAEVMLTKAEQNLTRQRQLTVRGAGTNQELQNIENDYRAAQASRDNTIVTVRNVIANAMAARVNLDVAEQTLADMTVKAPVPTNMPKDVEPSGPIVYAITRRPVHEGQMVKEGEALFDLVIQRPLRLWVNVPERFTPEIEVGQSVRLNVAARPGEAFTGQVARINPSVDPVSRTFQVEALVPNPTGLLRPGGFAKAAILTRRDSEAVVVPTESVIKYAGVTKIFVVEGEKARAIPVETGLEGKDWIEVKGELPTRGQVVTSGQSMLANGTPVTIRTEEPEADNPAEEAKPAEGEATKAAAAPAPPAPGH